MCGWKVLSNAFTWPESWGIPCCGSWRDKVDHEEVHPRILSVFANVYICLFHLRKTDKVWHVSQRLHHVLRKRKIKPCRLAMFFGIGGDASYIESEHGKRPEVTYLWMQHVSFNDLDNEHGPEKVSAMAPAGRVTQAPWLLRSCAPASQKRALWPGRQAAVPPSCPAGSAFTGRGGSPRSTVHCWVLSLWLPKGQDQPAGTEPVWPCN